ncbi:MAG: apolipoprotein N-acyltransferase [Candidatus Marinimicrobia bacterium]|nr:apolipoprotein N-acyltransferase [Candidatus Neomarinimicrobiota bacterium]
MHFLSPWKSSIISGVIIGLTYHPHLHLGILAYIGFIPLFHSWFCNESKINFKSGYLFGIIYNITSNYWIATNSGAPFIVVLISLLFAALYLSIFWGIAGAMIGLINGGKYRLIILPFMIVSLEWVRSFGPLGFPWGNLALTQMDMLVLLQIIEVTGTYGITFIIIFTNALIYYHFYVQKIQKSNIFYFISFSILLILFGLWKIKLHQNPKDYHHLNVSVIQPNIDPNQKWDISTRHMKFKLMDSLHTEAIKLNPELILFPETALPTYLRINNQIRNKLQSVVNNSKIPILIGTVDREIDSSGVKSYYNSAMYMQPGKNFEMYNKIHLVPFAEYDLVPSLFHPLVNLNLNLERGVFKGGNDYKIFHRNKTKFSNLICYESSLPRYARNFVKNGAQLLMLQANDGWLGKSSGPLQHFEHARLRAIENRVPIVRCGNTGISGIILPTGNVEKKISLGKKAVFNHNLIIRDTGTFYTKYGDVFAVICFILTVYIGPLLSCRKD